MMPGYLAALAPFLEKADAAALASRVAVLLGRKSGSIWGEALAALALRLPPTEQAPFARALAERLENESDDSLQAGVGEALALLAPTLEKNELESLLAILAPESENDSQRRGAQSAFVAAAISRLGEPARPLAAYLAFRDFSEADDRGLGLRWYGQGSSLVNWATALPPAARRSRLLAIATWLEQEPDLGFGPERADHRNLKLLLGELSEADLIEILKWPFCLGEPQKLVLRALEGKLTDRLGTRIHLGSDDPSRGISIASLFGGAAAAVGSYRLDGVDKPARRPLFAEALEELGPPPEYYQRAASPHVP